VNRTHEQMDFLNRPCVVPKATEISEHTTCSANPILIGSPESRFEPIQKQLAGIRPTIEALLAANFTLYSTSSSPEELGLPKGVRALGIMPQAQFLDVLGNVSFALGVGYPLLSPSPLDALANGAAFLNPIFPDLLEAAAVQGDLSTNHTAFTQHDALANLNISEPYVHTVDFLRPETVVRAARRTLEERFSSFMVEELHPDRIAERVCGALTMQVHLGIHEHEARQHRGRASNARYAADHQVDSPMYQRWQAEHPGYTRSPVPRRPEL